MLGVLVMARIQTRQGKKRTTYTATVRVKGFSPLARTFDTKGEAKTWAADIEKEMRMGRYQDARPAEKLTFAEVLSKYLEQVSSTKRPNSERRDKDSVQAILNGFGSQISLSAINAQRLAAYRDARLRSVSPSTIQKEFALLSHMFNIANREWGLTVDNPVRKVSRPKIRNGRTRFLTKDEAQRLLDCAKASKNEKLYPYLLVMVHTGMRPSEAAGLRWGGCGPGCTTGQTPNYKDRYALRASHGDG
jgi:integrase